MKFILTRTDEISGCVEKVIAALKENRRHSDIKLCLYELLSNAIIHGNQKSLDKKVYLEVVLSDSGLNFFVHDEGDGFFGNDFSLEFDLNEHGRGLFLISQIADEFGYDDLTNTWLVKIKW